MGSKKMLLATSLCNLQSLLAEMMKVGGALTGPKQNTSYEVDFRMVLGDFMFYSLFMKNLRKLWIGFGVTILRPANTRRAYSHQGWARRGWRCASSSLPPLFLPETR